MRCNADSIVAHYNETKSIIPGHVYDTLSRGQDRAYPVSHTRTRRSRCCCLSVVSAPHTVALVISAAQYGDSRPELLLAVMRGKHQASKTHETASICGAPHKILPQKPFPPLDRHMYNRQITHSIEQSRHAGNSCGCLPAE